jgi:hypothetical protein
MNNQYNQDYIKGMKILLRISYKRGANIRKIKWIPSFCQKLSEHGVCEAFWKEVVRQNTMYILRDYLPSNPKILVSLMLTWNETPQGNLFWNRIYNSLPNKL